MVQCSLCSSESHSELRSLQLCFSLRREVMIASIGKRSFHTKLLQCSLSHPKLCFGAWREVIITQFPRLSQALLRFYPTIMEAGCVGKPEGGLEVPPFFSDSVSISEKGDLYLRKRTAGNFCYEFPVIWERFGTESSFLRTGNC